MHTTACSLRTTSCCPLRDLARPAIQPVVARIEGVTNGRWQSSGRNTIRLIFMEMSLLHAPRPRVSWSYTNIEYLMPLLYKNGMLRKSDPETTLCGARTRRGTRCQCLPVTGRNRCKFHGGLSSGPKTAAGRERIAEAQRERWRRWRTQNRTVPK